jgi:hypothetical protein
MGNSIASPQQQCGTGRNRVAKGLATRSQRHQGRSTSLCGLCVGIFVARERLAPRRFGLSLGDRCCLALGIARKATVLTSQGVWSRLRIGLRVKLIR